MSGDWVNHRCPECSEPCQCDVDDEGDCSHCEGGFKDDLGDYFDDEDCDDDDCEDDDD